VHHICRGAHWASPRNAIRLTGFGGVSDWFISYEYDGGENVCVKGMTPTVPSELPYCSLPPVLAGPGVRTCHLAALRVASIDFAMQDPILICVSSGAVTKQLCWCTRALGVVNLETTVN
jgi:hypothetical protein